MRFDRAIEGNLDGVVTFFDEPVPAEPNAELWVDLSKVEVVNSTGLMRWMKWCKSHPAGLRVFLTHCPWNFAVQSSIMQGFFPPNCRLQSIRTYFYCEKDHEEKNVLLNREKDYLYAEDSAQGQAEIRLPTVLCPKCSLAMEPDFVESRLFAFLKS